MLRLLWLVPGLPFLSFGLITLLSGTKISRRGIATLGVGSIGISAILSILIAYTFISSPPTGYTYMQTYWKWIEVSNFTPHIAFHLDSLSLIMMLVVTFVGFLIHLYSADFMEEDEGYARFFSYMNLFVGMMLVLVLADNLLLLYLGWEGVGLSSYLLIGFWFKDPSTGRAARKAFIITRIGDAAFAIGLFLLFDNLGTLQIQDLMNQAALHWQAGSALATSAALLLLGGAVGKSAQLPLQTWLPDAMAGPTPVSALIHAATMVTAGVYLIARMHVLFSLAPSVMLLVAIIGALTLLLAGFSALTQHDIKRVLAYSTMSQIGYMFLALGVGAWSAAIFHFMTHAFFKALLFLGAGVIISRLDHEHNMFKMGGLRKELPLTFWTFLLGSASLAALPLVTAGFYSKDKILFGAWSSTQGSLWLWAAGLLGALLTGMYTFRMVFLTFFGEPHSFVKQRLPLKKPGLRLTIPLVVLAFLSVTAGLLDLPDTLGNFPLLSDFLHTSLPSEHLIASLAAWEPALQIIAGLISLLGIYIAYWYVLRRPQARVDLAKSGIGAQLHNFWFAGWGFDWLERSFLVKPFVLLAQKDKNDVVDSFYDRIVLFMGLLSRTFSLSENGRLRWYAAGIFIGAVITVTVVIFL